MQLDPLSTRRPAKKDEATARLYVGGIYMTEGSISQMHRLFEQECAAHSAVVEIRSLSPVGERIIRKRSVQR